MASGIEGIVTIGPRCPAETQDSESCENAPFEATIVIREADSEDAVATVKSAADGTFRVELPPGEYVVEPESRNQFVPPYADAQHVAVYEGKFTTIEIAYDSGIR
jgi:hypothetical protein